MKSIIKRILRESLKPFLTEGVIEFDEHSIDRIKQRIETIPNNDFSDAIKRRVFMNLDKLKHSNLNPNYSFALMLVKFSPDVNSSLYKKDNTGSYYSIWTTEDNSIIKDSTGDEVWIIVRNNTIRTLFLRKGYQTKDNQYNKEKLNVDYVFKNTDMAIERLSLQDNNVNVKIEPIININGVKWFIDTNTEEMYKKNKPNDKYKVDSIINQLDTSTQEKILSFF